MAFLQWNQSRLSYLPKRMESGAVSGVCCGPNGGCGPAGPNGCDGKPVFSNCGWCGFQSRMEGSKRLSYCYNSANGTCVPVDPYESPDFSCPPEYGGQLVSSCPTSRLSTREGSRSTPSNSIRISRMHSKKKRSHLKKQK